MNARLSFGGLMRSEWIKLWSVRATYWCLLIAVVLMVGIGFIGSAVGGGVLIDESGNAVRAVDSASVVSGGLSGILIAQLVIAVLGCLVITGEFGTGMIRTTFVAAPGRIATLLAKALVFAIVSAITGVVAIALSLLIAVPVRSARFTDVDLGDAQIWRVAIGAVVYLALTGLLGFAVGLIIRVSAGAIATAIGLLIVLPVVASILSGVTQSVALANVFSFLPSSAGGSLYRWQYPNEQTSDGSIILSWQEGGLVLLAWVVVLGALGIVLARRRDV